MPKLLTKLNHHRLLKVQLLAAKVSQPSSYLQRLESWRLMLEKISLVSLTNIIFSEISDYFTYPKFILKDGLRFFGQLL